VKKLLALGLIVFLIGCSIAPGIKIAHDEIFLHNPGFGNDEFVLFVWKYIEKNLNISEYFADVVFLYDDKMNMHGVIIVLLK